MASASDRSAAPYPSRCGGGAPRGSSFDSPYAVRHPNPSARALPSGILDAFGQPGPPSDPAYAPPDDPLKRGNPLARAAVSVTYTRSFPTYQDNYVNRTWLYISNSFPAGAVEVVAPLMGNQDNNVRPPFPVCSVVSPSRADPTRLAKAPAARSSRWR